MGRPSSGGAAPAAAGSITAEFGATRLVERSGAAPCRTYDPAATSSAASIRNSDRFTISYVSSSGVENPWGGSGSAPRCLRLVRDVEGRERREGGVGADAIGLERAVGHQGELDVDEVVGERASVEGAHGGG